MKITLHGRTAYAYTGGKAFDATLPGIVFIHGAMHDHSGWIQQTRYLAHHGYAVLAVDLPGHGRSEGPPLGVVEAGQWVADLVHATGLQSVALAGHSMGSLIALEAAARLRPTASHLFMIGTAYPMKVSAQLLELAQRDPLAAIDLVNSLSISTLAAKPSHHGPGFFLHGGNLFHFDFTACNEYAGLEAAAAALACPATLILGDRDQMTSPKAVAPLLAALKPTVVRLASGHAIMAECPDGLLDTLVAALRRKA
jgi:pimeloyl-ACP methyl ester carboxylesterase